MVTVATDWDISARFNYSGMAPNACPVERAPIMQDNTSWPVNAPRFYGPGPNTFYNTIPEVHTTPADVEYVTFKVDRRNNQMSFVSRSEPSNHDQVEAYGNIGNSQQVENFPNVPLVVQRQSSLLASPARNDNPVTMRGPLVQRKPRSEKSSGIAKRPLSTDGRRSALNRGRCVNYLLVGDYANIEKEIRLRFSKIQQNPLRSIAKAIIQRVEPSKQRDHPYTESRKGEMGGEEKKDAPTKVPSPWWPSDIKWREPDHLKMADRTSLLVHIVLMCLKNPEQWRACLRKEEHRRCKTCKKFHQTWGDLMYCTWVDDGNIMDLRDVPNKDKTTNPTENGNKKIPARRAVLKEIFLLAAEVERSVCGQLDKSHQLWLRPIPFPLAKESMKNRRSRAKWVDEGEEQSSNDEDEDDADDDDEKAWGTGKPDFVLHKEPLPETGAHTANNNRKEQTNPGAIVQPLQNDSLAVFDDIPFARTLSHTSASTTASPHCFDRRSLHEGMEYAAIPQEMPMPFYPLPHNVPGGFEYGQTVGYPQPVSAEFGNNDCGTIFELQLPTASAAVPYSNAFVGFATGPCEPSSVLPSDVSASACSYTPPPFSMTDTSQPWLEYCNSLSNGTMGYWG